MSFPKETLTTWTRADEVQIETSRGGGAPVHLTTIWIVVDAESVYIRSVRGTAGRWYREVVANPSAAIHADGNRVAVVAHAATDPQTVASVSEALDRKYRKRWPGPTASMLREEVLGTTLRLEPAS